MGVAFRRAPGEAAFYGPKIDVQVRDAAGREETLATIQIDRVMPERFGLSYIIEAVSVEIATRALHKPF